jgi:hypothetical protein
MTDYVKFTEENDWEGETWHFYIPVDGNQLTLSVLAAALETSPIESYTLDLTPIPESEVDTLVKHTEVGYTADHTKLSGVLLLAPDTVDQLSAYDTDPFYKGEIAKFVQAPA